MCAEGPTGRLCITAAAAAAAATAALIQCCLAHLLAGPAAWLRPSYIILHPSNATLSS